MPAQDSIHDEVVNALRKEGWTITHDPLKLEYEEYYLYVDFAAERFVTAERGLERIAVEVKAFVSPSVIADLQQAIGQFVMYREILRVIDPGVRLYLAVSIKVYNHVFSGKATRLIRERLDMPLIAVDIESEEVLSWLR